MVRSALSPIDDVVYLPGYWSLSADIAPFLGVATGLLLQRAPIGGQRPGAARGLPDLVLGTWSVLLAPNLGTALLRSRQRNSLVKRAGVEPAARSLSRKLPLCSLGASAGLFVFSASLDAHSVVSPAGRKMERGQGAAEVGSDT